MISRTIVKGLLRSKKILDNISEIPCDVIQTLENDAEAAETFVTQLGHGEVPTIIRDLPQELIGVFTDVVGIAAQLPTAIFGAANSAVTDAAKIFDDIEDGSIVSDIEKVPGVVASDVVAGWGDLTKGLEAGWADATHAIGCIFGDCPATTTQGNTQRGSCSAGSTTAVSHPARTTSGQAGTTYPSSISAYKSSIRAQSAHGGSGLPEGPKKSRAPYTGSIQAIQPKNGTATMHFGSSAVAPSSQTMTVYAPVPTSTPTPSSLSTSWVTSISHPVGTEPDCPTRASREADSEGQVNEATLGELTLTLWL